MPCFTRRASRGRAPIRCPIFANPNGEWRFVVRRIPGGKGSNAMFDALAPGDSLTIDGPYGNAYLREDNERLVVCVGGGSGVGPVVSVARAALKLGRENRIRVFEGARTRADLCVPALLTESEMAALHYTPVLSSEPDDSDWSGARGFVHGEVEKALQLPGRTARILFRRAAADDRGHAGPAGDALEGAARADPLRQIFLKRGKAPEEEAKNAPDRERCPRGRRSFFVPSRPRFPSSGPATVALIVIMR